MNITSHTVRNTFAGCTAILAGSLFSSSILAQTSAPAEVPTSLHGTYELTFDYEQNGSPIADDTVLEFVFAPGNYVCVAGAVIGDPILRNGNGHEAIWTVDALELEIALSSLIGGFNEVNIGGLGGAPFYGQFRGSKTSNSTDCPGLVPAPDLTAINALFALAQEKFADLFGDSNIINQELDDYIYRFYPTTGIYLAVKEGDVYILGGGFDLTNLGTIAAITGQLEAIQIDIPDLPDGDSTLVITGTVTTSGVTVTIPDITVANLPMPASNDIDDVRDAVIEQFSDSGLTGTVSVTLISSSSSSIVFNITFNGSLTQSGFTFTQGYNITYTYTAN